MVDIMEKLGRCEAEIAGHSAALEKAYAAGEEAGREAAAAEFVDSREAALAALAEGIADARQALATQLEEMEHFALAVAHQALSSLIGDPERYRELIRQMIRQQIAALADQTILSVTVSRFDFPDTRETDALLAELGPRTCGLTVSEQLGRGRCDIGLRVGTIEIDLDKNWREIGAALSAAETDDDAGA